MALIGMHSWEDDDLCGRCGYTRRHHRDDWSEACDRFVLRKPRKKVDAAARLERATSGSKAPRPTD